jgi:hypothetical protein
MTRIGRLVIFIGVISALIVAPAAAASASVTHKPNGTSGVVRQDHEIRMEIRLTPAEVRQGRAEIPDSSGPYAVSTRTSCGGFNGQVEWGSMTLLNAAFLDVWGELWNNACPGAKEYLYVSYTVGPGGDYNPQIASAPYNPVAGSNTGVNWSTDNEFFNFGNIEVDACDNYKGWTCGNVVKP